MGFTTSSHYNVSSRINNNAPKTSLKCYSEYSRYTEKDTGIKAATLTEDEMAMAGVGRYNVTSNAYISENANGVSRYWTLSPLGYRCVWNVWINTSGMDCNYGNTTYGYVRPTVALKASVTATGTGTKTDPYVVTGY